MKYVYETVVLYSIERFFYIQKYGQGFFPVVCMVAELASEFK